MKQPPEREPPMMGLPLIPLTGAAMMR